MDISEIETETWQKYCPPCDVLSGLNVSVLLAVVPFVISEPTVVPVAVTALPSESVQVICRDAVLTKPLITENEQVNM